MAVICHTGGELSHGLVNCPTGTVTFSKVLFSTFWRRVILEFAGVLGKSCSRVLVSGYNFWTMWVWFHRVADEVVTSHVFRWRGGSRQRVQRARCIPFQSSWRVRCASLLPKWSWRSWALQAKWIEFLHVAILSWVRFLQVANEVGTVFIRWGDKEKHTVPLSDIWNYVYFLWFQSPDADVFAYDVTVRSDYSSLLNLITIAMDIFYQRRSVVSPSAAPVIWISGDRGGGG